MRRRPVTAGAGQGVIRRDPSSALSKLQMDALLTELVGAALEHATEVGDFYVAVDDLEEILRAAWRVMTLEQKRELFTQPEMVALAEVPEFEPIFASLTHPGG